MNLISNISKYMINTYRIHNKYPTCNRDICYCITSLNLNIHYDYIKYDKCYYSSKLFQLHKLKDLSKI